MNAVHFSKDGDMTPLYNKLYSFDNGAQSENKEVLEAIEETTLAIDKDVTSIFDRGMDRTICRDYIIENTQKFILRLKGSTKFLYKGKELNVKTILTVAMSIIYQEIASLHAKLITQSGVKTCNKDKLYELYNFMYFKIGTIIKVLLSGLTPRAFLSTVESAEDTGQLCLALDFDS